VIGKWNNNRGRLNDDPGWRGDHHTWILIYRRRIVSIIPWAFTLALFLVLAVVLPFALDFAVSIPIFLLVVASLMPALMPIAPMTTFIFVRIGKCRQAGAAKYKSDYAIYGKFHGSIPRSFKFRIQLLILLCPGK
jgi:hypothetical protein